MRQRVLIQPLLKHSAVDQQPPTNPKRREILLVSQLIGSVAANVEFFRKLLDRQGHLAIALIGFEGVVDGFAEQRKVHFHHI